MSFGINNTEDEACRIASALEKIVKAEIVHLKNNDGILIHSQYDGKDHLSLQQYCNGTMYVVTCTFDDKDKYGMKEFMPMMKSVKCL